MRCFSNCIGANLKQGHGDTYESQGLQGAEKLTPTYEKELIVVVHVLKIWKHYLMGAKFAIHTNHQSLRYFLFQPKIS